MSSSNWVTQLFFLIVFSCKLISKWDKMVWDKSQGPFLSAHSWSQGNQNQNLNAFNGIAEWSFNSYFGKEHKYVYPLLICKLAKNIWCLYQKAKSCLTKSCQRSEQDLWNPPSFKLNFLNFYLTKLSFQGEFWIALDLRISKLTLMLRYDEVISEKIAKNNLSGFCWPRLYIQEILDGTLLF